MLVNEVAVNFVAHPWLFALSVSNIYDDVL